MCQSLPSPVARHEIGVGNWTGLAYLPSARAVRRCLIGAAVAIVLLGYLREWLRLGYGVEGTSFFNLNREQNIGAWFSATLLAGCAVLLVAAGRHARATGQRLAWFWFVLSVTFVALSIDEASSVHETLMVPIQKVLHADGLFKYAWVIPALVLVPVFALASLPFLAALPRRTAVWFCVAGALYVTGALGFEMLEGLTDGVGLTFVLMYLVEETLEIAGILSFFFSLMEYLAVFPPSPAR